LVDFDLVALYEALDAKRGLCGLTWQALAHEVTDRQSRQSDRRIAPSTFRAIATRQSVRDTVVLQALSWLGRTPESFVPGLDQSGGKPVPGNETGRPAFDTRAIYRAMDKKREALEITWADVARHIGPGFNSDMLKRLAGGTHVGFPRVMKIFKWLDRSAAEFVYFVPDVAE
jgi:hypothetical protein